MKNMNTKFFMMLSLLAVGSFGIQARHTDDAFIGQMHDIQHELSDVKHEARNNTRQASNKKLASIKSEIRALNKDSRFRDNDMHGTHIRTLEREWRHAHNIVRDHGLNK